MKTLVLALWLTIYTWSTAAVAEQSAGISPSTVQAPTIPNDRHGYINSDGNFVHTPVHAASAPEGATAHCKDGKYSFSQHHSGTCSHHVGVSSWL